MWKPNAARSRADGSAIYYELEEAEVADAAAGDVVLCDGVGCDGYVWKHLRAALRAERRIIHPHYRGHGRSPAPPKPPRASVADLALDVASAAEAAGSRGAVFFGHSVGVQVCLEVYRAAPELVRGLVLLCGASGRILRSFRGGSSLETALPRIRRLVERAPNLVTGAARKFIPTRAAYNVAAALEIDAERVGEPDFMPYLEGLAHVDSELFLAVVASAAEHSAADLLPAVRVPTLVVAGGNDGFTPPHRSRQLAETIPHAELLWIDGGSHSAPLEHPERVAAGVSDFLRRRVEGSAREGPLAGIAPSPGAEGDDFD